VLNRFNSIFEKNLPKVRPLVRTKLNKMKNKTQRRIHPSIHKYFFSHYFCFVFFRKNIIRGNAATNNKPNEGGKFHRGKVKEVEMFQYERDNVLPFQFLRETKSCRRFFHWFQEFPSYFVSARRAFQNFVLRNGVKKFSHS
jgi:hypothetical protein